MYLETVHLSAPRCFPKGKQNASARNPECLLIEGEGANRYSLTGYKKSRTSYVSRGSDAYFTGFVAFLRRVFPYAPGSWSETCGAVPDGGINALFLRRKKLLGRQKKTFITDIFQTEFL
jgi:hypothetical protein